MIKEVNAFDALPGIPDKSHDTVAMCLWAGPKLSELRSLIRHGRRIARHNVVIETVADAEYHRARVLTEKLMVDEILWVKQKITTPKWTGRRPGDCVERIMVIRGGKDSFFQNIYTYGRPTNGGGRNPEYRNPEGRRLLPQVWHGWYSGGDRKRYNLPDRPQPVWLLEQLFYCYTPPGGSILEIGAGSGSGWLAAKRLGFRYTGLEVNPQMVSAAYLRVSENPVEQETNPARYMTQLVTRHNNRYAENVQRREVA